MRQYTIIVPVFNQRELVMRCLDSVRRNTPQGNRLIIVDDASTDKRLVRELQEAHRTPGAFALREALIFSCSNRGFVRSANRGIQESATRGDAPLGGVILLNSDTEVPPGWIERLDRARDAAEARGLSVAAINPLSNDATLYSVPGAGTNILPAWLSTDQMDQVVQNVAQSSSTRVPYPETPTAVGFCMLMTREALDVVGELDVAFGHGYGEEVDWCQRARAAGFACVLCDDLFVWHQGHASFGRSDAVVRKRWDAVRMVRERWPEYENEVKAWWLDAHLREQRIRIADAIRPRPAHVGKPRKLWVMHSYHTPGGVEAVVQQAIRADRTRDHIVVWPRCPWQTDGEVYVDEDGTLCLTMSPELVGADVMVRGWPLVGADSTRVERWFAAVLQAVWPSEVGFQHLAGWGCIEPLVMLAESCVGLGSVSVAVHDDYPLCPAFRMGGACAKMRLTAGEGCRACINDAAKCTAEVSHEAVHERAWSHVEQWRGVLARYAECGDVTAPSESMAARITRAHGVAVEVVPHVVEPPRLASVRHGNAYTDRVRVAWVGSASLDKGWAAFAEFVRITGPTYELHVFGGLADDCDCTGLGHVQFHGPYVREELACWLQRVDVAVPAIARNEAFGLVVDECVAAGVEVVCANVDAVRERHAGESVAYEWGNVESLRDAVAMVASL